MHYAVCMFTVGKMNIHSTIVTQDKIYEVISIDGISVWVKCDDGVIRQGCADGKDSVFLLLDNNFKVIDPREH